MYQKITFFRGHSKFVWSVITEKLNKNPQMSSMRAGCVLCCNARKIFVHKASGYTGSRAQVTSNFLH